LEVEQGIPLLAVSPEVLDPAKEYDSVIGMPDRAKTDALHIALDTSLLPCGTTRTILLLGTAPTSPERGARVAIQKVNARRMPATPIICTPEELINV
jgi:hypothetical protein